MLSNRARLIVRTVFLTLLGAGAAGGAIGLAVLFGGFYDISASKQHFPVVYNVLEEGMQYSVSRHARGIRVPALDDPQQLRQGAVLYRAHCLQCHGGPGAAPAVHGMSMQPAPGPLVDADTNWQPNELYWITRKGIKMSGMPAWEFHLSEPEIWSVVAFVTRMPAMTAQEFSRLTAPDPAAPAQGESP